VVRATLGAVAGSLSTTGNVEVLVDINGVVGSGGKVKVKTAGWGNVMFSFTPVESG